MSYDLQELNVTYERLVNSHCEGIQGVLKFDGLIPGPVIGITLCTHGNEPSGLATAHFLMNHLSRSTLLCGTLYLVLNNIEATRKYFTGNIEVDKICARYVDVNMNRLPKDVLELMNDSRYEIKRVQELNRIWKRFTVGLDIHTTTASANPMIVSRGGKFDLIAKLIRGFPINILISNIEHVENITGY